jgi:hypothetical protein
MSYDNEEACIIDTLSNNFQHSHAYICICQYVRFGVFHCVFITLRSKALLFSYCYLWYGAFNVPMALPL